MPLESADAFLAEVMMPHYLNTTVLPLSDDFFGRMRRLNRLL